MNCLRLPGSPTGLVHGKWLMRTQSEMWVSLPFLEWELWNISGICHLPASSLPVQLYFALHKLFQDSHGSE